MDNNPNTFFSSFPPDPNIMRQTAFPQPVYPQQHFHHYQPVYVPCPVKEKCACDELKTKFEMANKNIELLNEQIKLLDMKLSVHIEASKKKENNNRNHNQNRKRQQYPPPPPPPPMFPKPNYESTIIITDDVKPNFSNGLLGGMFSFMDNSGEKDKKNDKNIEEEEEVVEDYTEYDSDDEYEELDYSINTIDDLIKLGKLYVVPKVEPKPDPEPPKSEFMFRAMMMRDGSLRTFNRDPKPVPKPEVKPEEPKKSKYCHIVDGKKYNINLEVLNKLTKPLLKLNSMIGLASVKGAILDMILYYLQDLEVKNTNMLHAIIEGPPGVGKTQLGKILAEIYAGLGVIPSSKFKLVKRSDLIGQYLGHTARQTQKVIDEADGGVLFIDEAYSLGNEDKRDSFSKECIDTINQNLSENKKKFICIIAGYADELDKCLFAYNPGLKRRFPFKYSIDGYDATELKDIFLKKVADIKWKWDTGTEAKFAESFFEKNLAKFPYFGGDMDNLLLNCKFAHSRRIFGKHPKNKRRLTPNDIEIGFERFVKNKKKDVGGMSEYVRNTLYN